MLFLSTPESNWLVLPRTAVFTFSQGAYISGVLDTVCLHSITCNTGCTIISVWQVFTFKPIPTGHRFNQPIYSYCVTQVGRNRVKVDEQRTINLKRVTLKKNKHYKMSWTFMAISKFIISFEPKPKPRFGQTLSGHWPFIQIIYRTRATITRSWSVTALVYKPRILGLKDEEFSF